MPSLLSTIVAFTPVDMRVSAWYGEGGVRTVRPYNEATAGSARLSTGVAGIRRRDGSDAVPASRSPAEKSELIRRDLSTSG